MSVRSSVGVACPTADERAALLEWLTAAGFAPKPMIDADAISEHLESAGFEVLVICSELLRPAAPTLPLLGPNRPLIVVGEVDDPLAIADALRRDATYLARPLTPGMIALAVTLALAEGRPARRSRRQPVARVPATAHDMPCFILDLSYDGIRLDIPDQHRAAIPASFRVEVPMFHVNVLVHRVWVSAPSIPQPRPSVWCGVELKQNSEDAIALWRALVDHAPALTSELRPLSRGPY